jgi:hypothetical protein
VDEGPATFRFQVRASLPTRELPPTVSGKAFAYILACSDIALYIGSAGVVAKRLGEHGGPKGAKFTRVTQVRLL